MEPPSPPCPHCATMQSKAANLEIALTTSRRIGVAVGIIMATDKIREDEAFGLLVAASQRTGVKLRDIAETVTETGCIDVRLHPGGRHNREPSTADTGSVTSARTPSS